jgi:UDP-N-acetylmuramoyl-tripeptide--D-alanyl-D-alanine ligase
MKKYLLKKLKRFLRLLAKLTLWRYKPKIVGITGNVGKTSAKIATKYVLAEKFRVRASAKSFNNELGLPLTIIGDYENTGGVFFWLKVIIYGIFRIIFKSRKYPEVLVLEYGVDRPNDMNYLLDIARPDIGVVTAIGDIPVHVEYFTGKEALAREKSKLINQLPVTGFAILNADDLTVYRMKEKTRSQVMTFGFTENAGIKISYFETNFNENLRGVTFKLNYGGSFIPVRLNGVLGKAKGYTAAIAASVGLVLGVNLVNISEALSKIESPPGRMSLIKGIKGSWIIDDTYNASPLAVTAALETLSEIKSKRKIAVLGDMLEIGKYTAEAHEQIGDLAAEKADILISVGMRGKFISHSAIKSGMDKKNVHHFDNINDAGMFLQEIIKEGDLILVKASQSVRLEKVVKEVMAEPERAKELLVRQNKEWLQKKGSYEE